MRIAMVANAYYPHDVRVRREAEAIAEAGHQVDVVCLKLEGDSLHSEVNAVRAFRVPIGHRRINPIGYIFEYLTFFLISIVYLSILSLSRRYDLIHVHNMPNFLVFITILPRLLGAKVILDMHDPMPEVYQTHYKVSAKNWIIRFLKLEETLSCRYSDYFITVNDPMRELLIQRGLDPRRVKVVMNLPDPKIFASHNVNSPMSEERTGRFKLIYTGLISPRNGIDIAIEAIRMLRKEMPDLCLIIIGDGPHLTELKSLVKEYDLNENVIFKKLVPIDDIPKILLSCDVGISPHRDNAFTKLMFSTKVAEYLSLGLPVISARTYTMERYFNDSTLFYFEPGNALDFAEQVRLVRQRPDLVSAKKEAARERMNQLSWKEEKKKLVRLVESWGRAK